MCGNRTSSMLPSGASTDRSGNSSNMITTTDAAVVPPAAAGTPATGDFKSWPVGDSNSKMTATTGSGDV